MSYSLMSFRRLEGGEAVALIGEPGRKLTPIVWIDTPIRLHKLPNDIVRGASRDVPNAPTITSAVRTMLRAGKSLGITKSARQFLKDARRLEK